MTTLELIQLEKLLFSASLNISEFTSAMGSKLRRLLGGQRDTHIIICGSPRSGTSMFCNMLAASLDGFNFDRITECSSIETIRRRGNHVSKSPLDVMKLPEIVKNNIHGKRIIALMLMRDPRDIITSVHENVPERYFIGYEASCRVWGEYPNYKYAYDHVGLGEVNQAIRDARKLGGIEHCLLRYEDIVSDPQAVQNLLAEKFGFSFTTCFSQFHTHSDKHVFDPADTKPLDKSLAKFNRPLSTDWLQRWREPLHRQRIIEQFDYYPQLFDILVEYGYESDRQWYDSYIQQSLTTAGRQEP